MYTGLSTYVEDDSINLGILAPTSEGKTYAVTEPLQYFPSDDVLYIGQMSPKVLVRQKGTLIDKETDEPIHDKVQELRTKIRGLEKKKRAIKDRDKIADINEEIGNKLFEGIDKEQLLNNALNLLNEYDIDIGALNEQLLQDGTSGYGGAFVLILMLFILLVIIGAGFGLGFGG